LEDNLKALIPMAASSELPARKDRVGTPYNNSKLAYLLP